MATKSGVVEQQRAAIHPAVARFGHQQDGPEATAEQVAQLAGDTREFARGRIGELLAQDVGHLGDGLAVDGEHVVGNAADPEHDATS